MADRAQKISAFELVPEVWNRRKWLAVVVFAVIAAAVGSLAAFLPNVYRSTATVLVERHQVAETFVRPSVTGELGMRLQTIGQEILSRARLADLINRFGLYPELTPQMPMEAVVERMRRDIQIELKGSVEQTTGRAMTVAFNLSYRGRDPETVALVANTVASFYVDENVKMREQQATGTTEFLKAQLAEMKDRLSEQERRLGDFRARHSGELPQQMIVNLAMLDRLNAQLYFNSANQMRATERRAAMAKQLAEAGPAAGAPDAGAARLTKLKQELQELRGRFNERYPDVVRVKAEIAALERELSQDGPERATEPTNAAPSDPSVRGLKAQLADIDAEITALKAEERRLRQDIATYQRRTESAPQREQESQQLTRDYETTKEMYFSLLKRYEDAQLAENVEQGKKGEQFRILDPAIPARQPSAPNRMRLVLVGVLLGLGAAAGAAVLAEHIDTSFHQVDDLRSFTKVPVLASIPRLVSGADTTRQRRQRWLATASIALGLVLVVAASYHLAHGNDQLVHLLSRGAS